MGLDLGSIITQAGILSEGRNRYEAEQAQQVQARALAEKGVRDIQDEETLRPQRMQFRQMQGGAQIEDFQRERETAQAMRNVGGNVDSFPGLIGAQLDEALRRRDLPRAAQLHAVYKKVENEGMIDLIKGIKMGQDLPTLLTNFNKTGKFGGIDPASAKLVKDPKSGQDYLVGMRDGQPTFMNVDVAANLFGVTKTERTVVPEGAAVYTGGDRMVQNPAQGKVHVSGNTIYNDRTGVNAPLPHETKPKDNAVTLGVYNSEGQKVGERVYAFGKDGEPARLVIDGVQQDGAPTVTKSEAARVGKAFDDIYRNPMAQLEPKAAQERMNGEVYSQLVLNSNRNRKDLTQPLTAEQAANIGYQIATGKVQPQLWQDPDTKKTYQVAEFNGARYLLQPGDVASAKQTPGPGPAVAPKPTAAPAAAIRVPQDAIDALKADPSLAAQFQQWYGADPRQYLGAPKPAAPAAPAAPAVSVPQASAAVGMPAAPVRMAATGVGAPSGSSGARQILDQSGVRGLMERLQELYPPSKKTVNRRLVDVDAPEVARLRTLSGQAMLQYADELLSGRVLARQ